MLKTEDLSFLFFANHMPASMLNPFESISYQKVICAQSLGHKEATGTLRTT